MTLTFNTLRVQKFKVNGQSLPKIEWKWTDGRTDGQTNGDDCIIPLSLMRSVKFIRQYQCSCWSRNDLLCVELNFKHSVTHCSIADSGRHSLVVITDDLLYLDRVESIVQTLSLIHI